MAGLGRQVVVGADGGPSLTRICALTMTMTPVISASVTVCFDLDARIDLDEIESCLASIRNFHRASMGIAWHRPAELRCRGARGLTLRVGRA